MNKHARKIRIIIYLILTITLMYSIYIKTRDKEEYYLTFNLKNFENINVSIFFWDNKNESYSPDKRINLELFRNQFFANLTFPVSGADDLKRLRVDLGDFANNNVIMESIFLTRKISNSESDTVFVFKGGNQLQSVLLQMNELKIQNVGEGNITFQTSSTDGYFVVNDKMFEALSNYIDKLRNDLFANSRYLFLISLLGFFLFAILMYIDRSLFVEGFSFFEFLNQKALVFIFFGILFFLLLNTQIRLIEDSENKEKRKIVAKPEITSTRINLYPKKFDDYYGISFPLRNTLFHVQSVLKYQIFRSSPLRDQVIMGQDNFLFANTPEVVRDYSLTNRIDPETSKKILKIFKERQAWLERRGIKFYVMLLPNKNMVYPDKMPQYINRKTDVGMNQLEYYTKLFIENNIPTINPINELQKAKTEKTVYYKSDTHWNLFGGFIGYQKLFKALKKDFPEMIEYREDDFNTSIKPSNLGDLAYMCSLEDYILRDEIYMLLKDTNYTMNYPQSSDLFIHSSNIIKGDKKLKLVMFRDSYSNYLIPFLNLNFSDATYIWNYEFMDKLIEEKKPDVVIFECLQRFITYGCSMENSNAVVNDTLK